MLEKLYITPVTSLIQIDLLFFKEKSFFRNKDLLSEISLDNSYKDKPAAKKAGFSLSVIIK